MDDSVELNALRMTAGWPFKCVSVGWRWRGEARGDANSSGGSVSRVVTAIAAPLGLRWSMQSDAYEARELEVLWLGLCSNTALFSIAILAMVVAPVSFMRSMRERRGQCARCGYPRGPHPVCVECGAGVCAPRSTR
jgi:hypothetical protein